MNPLLLSLHLLAVLTKEAPVSKHELKVNISQIKDTRHAIYMAISIESDGFPGNSGVVKYMALDPDGKNNMTVSIADLPYGKYAIMIFQDMNGNKKLDKGFLGIPAEPFAFSNNFHPIFGPPKWKDCEFDYSAVSNLVTINGLLKM